MDKRLLVWLGVAGVVIVILIAVMTPASGGAENKAIGNEELLKLQGSGARVVDVRTPGEFEGGRIPNAENVPLENLQQAAAGWDKAQPIVLYCATGARSKNAASYLAGQGFQKIYDLTAGIVAWNGQVVSGQNTAQGSSDEPSADSGAGTVETDGKPLFIDFSGSA